MAAAKDIADACMRVLMGDKESLTPDLGGTGSTVGMGEAICAQITGE